MNQYFSADFKETEKKEEEIRIKGAGGAGCFLGDTFVLLHGGGYKKIKNLSPSDNPIGYDKNGNLEICAITKLHVHEYDEVGDIYNFNKGLLIATHNHGVYDAENNSHKESKDFKKGDFLGNHKNKKIKINNIKITKHEDLPKDTKVYNLDVEPCHTFFVSEDGKRWIKVHNGGGGKGGGQRAPREAANTLQSSAIAQVLEVISEGEIGGLVGGPAGVWLNGTRLADQNQVFNFSNVIFEERKGLPSQTVIPGFDAVKSEVSNGTEILNATPVSITITDDNVDAVDLTISLFQGLSKQDTTTGDLNGWHVSYKVETKTNGGTWQLFKNYTIKGKTTSSYEYQNRIEKPAGAAPDPWDIKITRTSSDNFPANERSRIKLQSYTRIQYENLTYDNTALVGIQIPAEQVGNKIPVRAYEVQGIICDIPSNYDPILKTYTGQWDGTFTRAWTDNGVWILYELIKNDRYGVNNVNGNLIYPDKWSFYAASVYSDELVPDGRGGTENRYTFNTVLQKRMEAWKLLQLIASSFKSVLLPINDTVYCIQDRPTSVSKIINNSNVVEGVFLYSSGDLTDNPTIINVTYNDKNDFYLPKTISVTNTTQPGQNNVDYGNGIETWGKNIKDFAAIGVVTESAAVRMAKWMLFSVAHQNDVVNFTMSLNYMPLQPGDVIEIQDDNLVGTKAEFRSGKIKAKPSSTQIVLDHKIDLDSSVSWKIDLVDYEGEKVDTFDITGGTGTNVDTLTVATTLGSYNHVGIEYIIWTPGNTSKKQYRITSIKESEEYKYDLTAVVYIPSKYSTIENNLSLPPEDYSNLYDPNDILQVTNIQFDLIAYQDSDGVSRRKLEVKWDDPNTSNILEYRIRYRRSLNDWSEYFATGTTSYTIDPVVNGDYDVEIYAVRFDGKHSRTAISNYSIDTAASTNILPPIDLFVYNTTGTTFNTKNLRFEWKENPGNANLNNVQTDKYVIEIRNSTTDNLIYTAEVNNQIKDYTYSYGDMENANEVNRSVKIRIYAKDVSGALSTTFTESVFTNPSPAAPSYNIIEGTNSSYIDITEITDLDLDGYIVYRNVNQGFTPGTNDIIYDGPDRYISVSASPGQTYYYRVAAYDSFGKTGLNIASETTSVNLSNSEIIFDFNNITITAETPTANTVYWTAGTATVNNNGTTTTYNISAGNSLWTSGTMYIYYTNTDTILKTTTDITQALDFGNQILGQYKGGQNLIVSIGEPLIDGNRIIAGTVGANQLYAGGAVITGSAQISNAIITGAHVVNGSIDNAKIGNIIESTNFNSVSHQGWRINKDGTADFNGITIYDNAGNNILSSGSGVNWNTINNTPGYVFNFSTNMLYNASLRYNLEGWSLYNANGNYGDVGIATDTWYQDWTPAKGKAPYRTFLARQIGTGTTSSDWYHFYASDGSINGVPVEAGEWYEFFGMVQAHRCKVVLYVDWKDSGGNSINASTTKTQLIASEGDQIGQQANDFVQNFEGNGQAGRNPDGWRQVGFKRIAPAGAVSAGLHFRKEGTLSGTDSYIFVNRPYIGRSSADQVEHSKWSSGNEGASFYISANKTSTWIANAAIGSAQIANASINNAHIANASINSAQIIDASITNAKIYNGAIDNAKIADASINSAKIIDGSILNADIGNGQITNAKIANASIDNAKIANAAVDTLKLAGQAVTIPESTYSNGDITTTGGSYTEVVAKGMTSTGAPVHIFVSLVLNQGGFNKKYRVMIKRSGTVIYESPYCYVAAGVNAASGGGLISLNIRDIPGAGWKEYRVYVDGSPSVSRRSLVLLETKR